MEEETRSSAIGREVERAYDQASQVRDLVDLLTGRLQPVRQTLPSSPETVKASKGTCLVPLAQAISVVNEKNAETIEALQNLIASIDL